MKRLTAEMYDQWRDQQDGPRRKCVPRKPAKSFHIPLPDWHERLIGFGVKLNIPTELATNKEPIR